MADEVIDIKEFMERVQDDKELLLELLDIFAEDSREKMSGLKDAINKKDVEAIKSIAHAMKGASGNISAKFVRQSFLRLEEIAKNGNLADAPGALQTLTRQMEQLYGRIEEIKKENQ